MIRVYPSHFNGLLGLPLECVKQLLCCLLSENDPTNLFCYCFSHQHILKIPDNKSASQILKSMGLPANIKNWVGFRGDDRLQIHYDLPRQGHIHKALPPSKYEQPPTHQHCPYVGGTCHVAFPSQVSWQGSLLAISSTHRVFNANRSGQ